VFVGEVASGKTAAKLFCLVDDHCRGRKSIERILLVAGYRVLTASGGKASGCNFSAEQFRGRRSADRNCMMLGNEWQKLGGNNAPQAKARAEVRWFPATRTRPWNWQGARREMIHSHFPERPIDAWLKFAGPLTGRPAFVETRLSASSGSEQRRRGKGVGGNPRF